MPTRLQTPGMNKTYDLLLEERETVTRMYSKCWQKTPCPRDETEAQRGKASTPTGKNLGGGAPGQKNTAAESKQWRSLFPGKRAEGAKVPCPLFSIFVEVRYCIWRHFVIRKSLHRCEWATRLSSGLIKAVHDWCITESSLMSLSYTTHSFQSFPPYVYI